jgi:hypothetical protein
VLQYSNKQGFSKNPVSKNWLAVLKEGSSTIIILVDLRIIPSGIDFSSKHVETVFWGTDWDTNMEAAFSEGCVSNSGRSAMRCQWSLLIQENRMKNSVEYEHGLKQQIGWLYQGILYLEVYPGSMYSPFACSTFWQLFKDWLQFHWSRKSLILEGSHYGQWQRQLSR